MEAPKTSIITRVYTEEDEIKLLQSMIKYKSKKGHAPVDNLIAFKNFVNPFLSFTATKEQVADKIRRLRKKFFNNQRREVNGEKPYFPRKHEDKLFRLSKKVWASEVDGDDNVKSGHDDVSVKSVKKDDGVEDCWLLYPFLCASLKSEANKKPTLQKCSKEYVKMAITGLDEEKARELEKEWEGFFMMEQRLYAKRTALIRKQSETLNDVISQSAAK